MLSTLAARLPVVVTRARVATRAAERATRVAARRGAARIGALMGAITGLLGAGCAEQLPPRPVPQPEAQPELPGWYPEKPWSEKDSQRVFLEGKIVFDTNRATIRPESERVLRQLLEYLQSNADISRIRLEGHTDERASEEHNQALSVRRAEAVADWLVDNGLDHMRLLAVAFGETRPLRSNATAEGRQENRRTSFHIAEVGGTRFMGRDPANGGLVLEILSAEERAKAKEVGKVPTVQEEPWTPTRDVIAPLEPPKPPAAGEPPPLPEPPPAKPATEPDKPPAAPEPSEGS